MFFVNDKPCSTKIFINCKTGFINTFKVFYYIYVFPNSLYYFFLYKKIEIRHHCCAKGWQGLIKSVNHMLSFH